MDLKYTKAANKLDESGYLGGFQMRLKGIKPFVLLIALVCLSVAVMAQNPTPAPKEKMGADQFEDAHRGMFTNQTDKAKEIGRLTDQVAQSVPGDAQPVGKIERKNFVDEYIFGRIEKDGIPHAGLSSDEEFIRRVHLDATGLLPTPEAVREFVANKNADKRDKLIDSLIGTEEFSEQWAWFWGDFYRLNNMGGNGKDAFQTWTKQWLKVDRPYNQVVSDLLTGSAKSHGLAPQLAFFGRILRNSGLKNRDLTDPDNIAATVNRLDAIDEMNVEISRIFLGLNTDCISCHDGAGHLESVNLFLSERTRTEFASQAAFLGKLRMVGTYNVNATELVLDDGAKGYTTGNDAPYFTESESRFPRTGETYEPAFMLTGEKPRPGMNPRAELARMITSHPQFNRATVNLIWGKLMTLGFVEPWDSFDLARLDPKNPPPAPWTVQPSYPELMEALAKDFQANNYSMHHLMKTIMKSNAYQLSSKFPGQWKDAYMPYYARKYVRVMTGPEVVDTVAQATGRPFKFEFKGTEVQRVKQVTDLGDIPERGDSKRDGLDVGSIMNSFFENNREAPVPTGNKATTLQAILMMSSNLVNDRVLAEGGGRVQQLLESGKTDEEIIDELYLSSLSRWPTATEKRAVLDSFEFAKDRKKGVQDLQWALLNGVEFALNH
jgi:uncharacterized protein YukE